jgi:hypothetical protein
MKNPLFLLAMVFVVSGCAAERSVVAQDAQHKMVGLNKEQVLACMGPPATKSAEGATEVWSYNSGDGHTSVAGFSAANATVSGGPYSATGTGFGNSFAVASTRYCVVNVVMVGSHVDRVNYSGPTGGLLTGGEQCAFAVRNCVQS